MCVSRSWLVNQVFPWPGRRWKNNVTLSGVCVYLCVCVHVSVNGMRGIENGTHRE